MAGALIRCETQLDIATIEALPGCVGAVRAEGFTEIRTTHAPTTLRTLLQRDSDLKDLTVTQPKLEDVFEDLVQ